MLTIMEQSINYRKHIEKLWTFKLEGAIPTKKNQYRRAKNKRMYKPKEVVNWEEDSIHQLITFFNIPEIPLEKVYIKIHLYFGNNRRTDPDGKLTSILDILQKAQIIKDDRWQCVPHFETSSSFRLNNPGAYIIIGELK
jgi:Holliday junction resolvase RusA-like endonuclease